jgi:hypothetical protein
MEASNVEHKAYNPYRAWDKGMEPDLRNTTNCLAHQHASYDALDWYYSL